MPSTPATTRAPPSVKNEYENISWVLYPNDSTPAGRELRLRQEYFFVAASMQDILARHLEENRTLANLADKVAIHLNDTHPAIGVAELMRLLCDEHGMAWKAAWAITGKVFSYTNHTLMPEALETWPVGLMQHVLPRHLEIILRINQELLDFAAKRRPGDVGFLARLSLIDESGERRVRMAHLSIVGSHMVNGVSALHSDLLVKTIFADFASLWPERFTNMTNGVTPRRWLAQANAGLAGLLDRSIGTRWRLDLDELRKLRRTPVARHRSATNSARSSAPTRRAWPTTSTAPPASRWTRRACSTCRSSAFTSTSASCSICCTWSRAIRRCWPTPPPTGCLATVIFAGKAASSYAMAKNIIRLVHDVGQVINADARLDDRLKVVFVPNYGVSVAEMIMPGADLSEQISTAGTEASGTGNMKLALNGALTIGTDDGANIEIRQHVGDDNIFIFGLQHARGSGPAQERLPAHAPVRKPAAAEGGARCDRRRHVLARRARTLSRSDRLAAVGRRPLLPAGRLCVVHRDAAACRRAVSPARAMGAPARSPTSRAWARSRRIARFASTRPRSGT